PPDSHHQREQEQREGNAQNSESAATFVAKGVLGDKSGQRHRLIPGTTGKWSVARGVPQHQQDRRSPSSATTWTKDEISHGQTFRALGKEPLCNPVARDIRSQVEIVIALG